MSFIKSNLKTLVLAIAAGFCIGIGGIVFLMQDSKLAGAFLFAAARACTCSNNLAGTIAGIPLGTTTSRY